MKNNQNNIISNKVLETIINTIKTTESKKETSDQVDCEFDLVRNIFKNSNYKSEKTLNVKQCPKCFLDNLDPDNKH